MWRRLVLLVAVVFALLGVRSPAFEEALSNDLVATAAGDCCPGPDDECCAAAACTCAVSPAILVPERAGVPERTVLAEVEGWGHPSAQEPHERSAAPPHPPPIA